MGYRVKWVWYLVSPTYHHQGAGCRWFHSRVHQWGRQMGQMNVLNGVYIQTGRPTNRLEEQVSCFFLLKKTRLSVWFASTSHCQQWSGVRSSSGRTRSRQSSRGHKRGYSLWLSFCHQLSKRGLRMQGWKDEEILGASKEKGGRPTCQDRLNPQRREWTSRLPCQSRFNRTHDRPRQCARFCSAFSTNRFRQCAGDSS